MKISSRKSKGSQFEMSVRDSLAQKYPDVLLTKQEGFVAQNDITIHSARIVIECKKHRAFSWNELKGYFKKLEKKAKGYTPYLIFQANRQPCLVMYNCNYDYGESPTVAEFGVKFGVLFIRHKGKKEHINDEKNMALKEG